MAIIFRNDKGSPLTYVEMDNNLGTFYVSSSLSGAQISLFSEGTGSTSAVTHSFEILAVTSSISSSYAVTASYANSASYSVNADQLDGLDSSVFLRNDQNGTLNGNLTVTGTLIAQEYHTEFVSASIIYESGSTQFGDTIDDTHTFTGSLYISGGLETVSEMTAANFVTTSDRRLKSEIIPIKNGLEVIKQFTSYEYFKNENKEAGFIAQEVQNVIPYAVKQGEDGYLRMNDRAVLAYIHKAVLELEQRITALEQK